MLKPDDDTTAALAQLSTGAQWELVEKWLLASREHYVMCSLNTDSDVSRQAQGSFMVIDAVLKATKAAQTLNRR